MKTTGEIEDEIAQVAKTVAKKNIIQRVVQLLQDLYAKRLATWHNEMGSDYCRSHSKCNLTEKGLALVIDYNSGSWRSGPMRITIFYKEKFVFNVETKSSIDDDLKVERYLPGEWEEILEIDKVLSLLSEQEKIKLETIEINIVNAEVIRRAEVPSQSLIDRAKKLGINLEKEYQYDDSMN